MILFKNEGDILITQWAINDFEKAAIFIRGNATLQFADELKFDVSKSFVIAMDITNNALLNPMDIVKFTNPKNQKEYTHSLKYLFKESDILEKLQPLLKMYRLKLISVLDADIEVERSLRDKLAQMEKVRVVSTSVTTTNVDYGTLADLHDGRPATHENDNLRESDFLNVDLELSQRIEANRRNNLEQRETILAEIDKALDDKNEVEFNRLTKMLKEYS